MLTKRQQAAAVGLTVACGIGMGLMAFGLAVLMIVACLAVTLHSAAAVGYEWLAGSFDKLYRQVLTNYRLLTGNRDHLASRLPELPQISD